MEPTAIDYQNTIKIAFMQSSIELRDSTSVRDWDAQKELL